MLEFILIIFLSHDGGAAIEQVTFKTAKECEVARARIESTKSRFYLYPKTVCVWRTTDKPLKPGVE